MAYFKYRLEVDARDSRHATIVAEADGTGPACTQQHTGKDVAYVSGIDTRDPGVMFLVPLPLSVVVKIVGLVEECLSGNNK